MRILHVHSGNLFGGVETILLALARHERTYSGLRSSFALAFDGRLARELTESGAPVAMLGRVQLRRPDRVHAARSRLKSVITRERPDLAIVHSSWALAVFGPVLRQVSVPLVLWAHAPEPGPWWLAAMARRVSPDLVICNSEYTRSRVDGRYRGVRVETCYAPLLPELPVRSPAQRASVRRDLGGVTDDTVVIAIAARFEPLKGHRRLIEALAAAQPSVDWRCWIIAGAQRSSERRYEQQLRDLAVRVGLSDRVWFLGERSDVPALLSAADLYCQPNESGDSFGLAYVEALAAGLPIVTTRTGAAPEVVDRSCGVLVPPGDTDSLRRTLEELIADAAQRRALGEAGR
ncbi:MAG TPA: glycosyltransferase, partial [Vicinamibacterales bacterium]|nr:glycosyltransferase [Vicinamibacterales bacterium]